MSEQSNQSPTPEPNEQAVQIHLGKPPKNVTWYCCEMRDRRRAAGTLLPAQASALWEGSAQGVEAAWERITGKDLRSCFIGEEDVYPVEVYCHEPADTINEDLKFPLKFSGDWGALMSNGLQISIMDGQDGVCSIRSASMNYIQAACLETAVFPAGDYEQAMAYIALGLCGEAGEFAEKVKKFLRGDTAARGLGAEELRIKELGDILWYLMVAIRWERSTAGQAATVMLLKLADRAKRGVLKGSGDSR